MEYIKLNQTIQVDGIIMSKDLVLECFSIAEQYVTRLGKVPKECADIVHPFYFIVNNKYYCAISAVDENEANRIIYNAIGPNSLVVYDESSWEIHKGSPLWDAALYCGKINPMTDRDSITYEELHSLTRIPLNKVKQYL